ncbi:MAG: Vitamin B12 dependent methionine synthase activation subunit [Clostridia bacterium]|nr:Vitamin B12 dependent methionine synthase activation subunit [Clostridia bacterium]
MQVFCVDVPLPPVNEKEILRYARCGSGDEQTLWLMRECLAEAEGILQGKVCFGEVPCHVAGERCDLEAFSLVSRDLSKNLQGCSRVVLFAATLGVGMDRLIAKYQRLSPAKAVMLHAIGAERIEGVCDGFCRQLAAEKGKCRPRFSPGYGDVPLDVQKQFFSLLQCEKHVGLYLNDSLLMSPSKSVTAFVGLEK